MRALASLGGNWRDYLIPWGDIPSDFRVKLMRYHWVMIACIKSDTVFYYGCYLGSDSTRQIRWPAGIVEWPDTSSD